MNKTLKSLFVFSLAAAVLFPVVAFALEVPIQTPDGQPTQSILELVLNWKTLTPFAIGAAIIVIAVQVLKHYVPEFEYKRLAVTVLGIAYGTILALQQGLSIGAALVASLLTSGGAVALYEALKPAIKKLKVAV